MSSKNIIENIPVKIAIGPVTRRDDAFFEEKEKNNGTRLLSGNHGKLTNTKPVTTITTSPDAVITDQTKSESSAVVYGATYECNGDTPAVSVKETGRMVFVACHFSKKAGTQTAASSYITVANGGHVACIGCYFHGEQGAGLVIKTAGPANSSSAIGCFNQTSRGHSGSVLVSATEVAI